MFDDEVVSLWSFLEGIKQVKERPEVDCVTISREMALFLADHINLLEEQLDAARSEK